jgi:hypothetical protein
MKNLLKGFALACALFVSGTIFGQTTLNVDNATNCTYKISIALSPSQGSCAAAGIVINDIIYPGSNSIVIPGTNGIRRVKFFASSGSSVVSYYCGANTSFGTSECGGLPVMFNFVQDDLIEISL